MKYLRTLEEPDPRDPVSVIEYVGDVELARATSHSDRWLALAIAIGVVAIGLGVGGRVAAPSAAGGTAGSSAAPLADRLEMPTAAPAEAIATPALADIVPIDADGHAVLAFTNATLAGSITVSLERTAPSGWSPGSSGLQMHGHATADVASVTVDVRSPSGSLLASAVVSNAPEDERPGSDGAPRSSADGLAHLLVVPGQIPPDGWQVEITWRDAAGASTGTLTQRVCATR